MSTPSPTQPSTDCAPCQGTGSIDMPVIVTETHYGSRQQFAKIESITCYDCRGTGTITRARH